VCYVFPAIVAFERAEFGGSSGKVGQASPIQTAIAIRIRIRSENRFLNLFLDAAPLLFWRLAHVESQIIMTAFRVAHQCFQVVERNLLRKR
jgi:hypothetical protein